MNSLRLTSRAVPATDRLPLQQRPAAELQREGGLPGPRQEEERNFRASAAAPPHGELPPAAPPGLSPSFHRRRPEVGAMALPHG